MHPDQITIRELADAVEDELGADIHYVFADERRRFILETVAASIALAVLNAYLVALLGPQDFAKKHRQWLSDQIGRIRAGDNVTSGLDDLAEQQLANIDRAIIDNTAPLPRESVARAEIEVADFLESVLNIPSAHCVQHARSITALVVNRQLTDMSSKESES
jgi:hypothetical protein